MLVYRTLCVRTKSMTPYGLWYRKKLPKFIEFQVSNSVFPVTSVFQILEEPT